MTTKSSANWTKQQGFFDNQYSIIHPLKSPVTCKKEKEKRNHSLGTNKQPLRPQPELLVFLLGVPKMQYHPVHKNQVDTWNKKKFFGERETKDE